MLKIDHPGLRIELQPAGILKRRGALITTLRHELAHVVIDAVSHNRAPRWLEEGFAIYLAGEGSLQCGNRMAETAFTSCQSNNPLKPGSGFGKNSV